MRLGDIVKGQKLAVIAAALAASVAASAGAEAANEEVIALQQRLAQMEREMATLRAELQAITTAKPRHEAAMQTLDARVAKVEQAAPAAPAVKRDHRLFFRGGAATLVEDRANGAFTDLLGGLGVTPPNDNDRGWYFGAGFDFLLSPDTLGLLPGVWAIAELGLEFRDLGSERTLMTGPTVGCLALGVPAATCVTWTGEENLMMLTVSASPKLKFREGAKLRPWIIPAGLDLNVISPPSDSTNYLDIGVQFGAGVDYVMLPGITFGVDFRYHWAADLTDPKYSAAQAAALAPFGVRINTDPDNDAWTAGVSLGISF